MNGIKTFLLASLLAGALAGAEGPSPATFGLLKDVPAFIQEWHIWWGFPYPDPGRPFAHMESTMTAGREPWRLNWNRNGYPLVGLYDAANREVIRWQIRCIKATGLQSVAVMLHPEWDKGIGFIQEKPDNLVQTILDLAAEEKYQVFFMDEVAFRGGSKAQEPDVTAARVIGFMKKYGAHPGLLRLEGKPVYYFQTYGWDIAPATLQGILEKVDAATGGVCWMMFGPVGRFGAIPQLRYVVDGASLHRFDRRTRETRLRDQDPEKIFATGHRLGKKMSDMQYPKFDGTGQPWRQPGVALYGKGGRTLETTLAASVAAKPDFVMFSSWNDWEEGANFEPGWDFDGFAGDPYAYCRVLAHFMGREFVPPPLPPKEALHPTIWEKLGYGDGAGPVIERVERSHVRGGSLTIVARDTASPVDALEAVWEGDWHWKAAQAAAPASGALAPQGPAPKGEQLRNVFGFTPGHAATFAGAAVDFAVPAAVPEVFAIGVADAFDPAHPLQALRARVPNRDPVRLREPDGAVRHETTLDLTPYPRADQLPAEFWDGWRTAVAVTPAPVRFNGKTLQIQGERLRLGQVSILGAPKPERTLTEGESLSGDGRRKAFRVILPDAALDRPGAHFLWLRARDAAGNWGSPKLVAVPNYEHFAPPAPAAAKRPPLSVPGAALADDCADLARWKDLGGRDAETLTQLVPVPRLKLGNAVLWRDFPPLADGSFRLSFRARHTASQRKMIVWLTDAAGRRGYGLAWDSNNPDQNAGTGTLEILKLDAAAPLDWATTGKPLASGPSGHLATAAEPAAFVFARDGKTGAIVVSVDGRTVLTASDPDFRDFSRLSLRGNQHQEIARVVLLPR